MKKEPSAPAFTASPTVTSTQPLKEGSSCGVVLFGTAEAVFTALETLVDETAGDGFGEDVVNVELTTDVAAEASERVMLDDEAETG